MNNRNAIAELSEKYQDCNLLLPVATEAQLNPFYKMTVMEVQADLQEGSGDIFKVGTVNINKQWIPVYSPAKPLLMKIAAAAGIQFDPANTFGAYVDGNKNCYRAKAYGALRLPDGTGKTHCDEKVINLDDEEDRFRLEFLDKSIQGITDKKQADEAAKLFKGEWRDSEDKFGKPCRAFFIADVDRQKYIDRGVLVNMTLLRKTMAEKAMTGAILRVIRALTGLKSTYTLEELKRPFAIPRVTFSPDYSDPEVRKAMLGQSMAAVTNMFGSAAAPMLAPSSINTAPVDPFNPEDFADNAAFLSDRDDPQEDFVSPTPPPAAWNNPTPPPDTSPDDMGPNTCAECGREINDKVSAYSIRQFGRPLCMACQKGAR